MLAADAGIGPTTSSARTADSPHTPVRFASPPSGHAVAAREPRCSDSSKQKAPSASEGFAGCESQRAFWPQGVIASLALGAFWRRLHRMPCEEAPSGSEWVTGGNPTEPEALVGRGL
jgi:hypothetical protein